MWRGMIGFLNCPILQYDLLHFRTLSVSFGYSAHGPWLQSRWLSTAVSTHPCDFWLAYHSFVGWWIAFESVWLIEPCGKNMEERLVRYDVVGFTDSGLHPQIIHNFVHGTPEAVSQIHTASHSSQVTESHQSGQPWASDPEVMVPWQRNDHIPWPGMITIDIKLIDNWYVWDGHSEVCMVLWVVSS